MTYRFGSGSKVYTFPIPMNTFDDNFADLVTNTNRMPGLSGGFDGYGNKASPASVGKIQCSFDIWVEWAMKTYSQADPVLAMQQARDAVNALRWWGKMKLWKPTGAGERFCYARVNNISMALNESRHTHLVQPVSIIFQASDPTWYEFGTEAPRWGEVKWGEFDWGGIATPVNCSGISTSWNVTTTGNAVTHPRISVIGLSGGVQNPTLQRIVDGLVVDEVSYTGTLAENDMLEINPRSHRVTLNGANAYTSAFDYETPDWFVLEPGGNQIRLLMANGGNAAQVYLRYYEAYT